MRYVLVALAAAALAFLAAPLLVGPLPPPNPAANLERDRAGHAFAFKDHDESDPQGDPRWSRILAGRPKRRPMPASCLDCHASIADRRKPLGCPDCHDPAGYALRLTRSSPAAPLRTAVCAQCHHRYDVEWRHAETGALVREPRHPQFEMWSEGIHARSGVACPDCHMPQRRRRAMAITDHRARTPIEMPDAACARCHRTGAAELRARVKVIQDRTRALAGRGAAALVSALDAIHDAQAAGRDTRGALAFQTEAQWRLEFVASDRSSGFHAPQYSARLLAESIDYARRAQLAAATAQPQ